MWEDVKYLRARNWFKRTLLLAKAVARGATPFPLLLSMKTWEKLRRASKCLPSDFLFWMEKVTAFYSISVYWRASYFYFYFLGPRFGTFVQHFFYFYSLFCTSTASPFEAPASPSSLNIDSICSCFCFLRRDVRYANDHTLSTLHKGWSLSHENKVTVQSRAFSSHDLHGTHEITPTLYARRLWCFQYRATLVFPATLSFVFFLPRCFVAARFIAHSDQLWTPG